MANKEMPEQAKTRATFPVIFRSLVAHTITLIAGLLYSLLLPFMFLPRTWTVAVIRTLLRLMFWLLKKICRLQYRVTGLENIPDRPCIIASKHQSAWEGIALQIILRDPAFVQKREVYWVPPSGWVMWRLDNISVNRSGDLGTIRDLIEQARKKLEDGRHVVIFPEGTRRLPGDPPAYLSGVEVLYRKLAVPFVPVAHNSGCFWPRRSLLRFPGTITIEFLPAISAGLDHNEFKSNLISSIEARTNELISQARQNG